MKRFWLVLLSLGLVMAFSVSAFAVDVKIGAEYFAGGLYLNKTSVNDGYSSKSQEGYYDSNPSTAFFYQRLRVGTDFIVTPCLKLVTRFDAMERIWGGSRSEDTDPYTPPEIYAYSRSAGTTAENENIAFDIVYIDYTSPIGQFKVGYMPDYVFGTVFADRGSGMYDGQIAYSIQNGPFTGLIGYAKIVDKNWSYMPSTYPATDVDYDSYRIGGIYNFKTSQVVGEIGALFIFDRDATQKGGYTSFDYNYLANKYVFNPYVKAKIGPVALQAEVQYWFGDAAKWEDGDQYSLPANVSISALSVFVDATANFGMFNVGGTFAYLSGDDPGTKDKVEGSGSMMAINTGGLDWNPCLIMFNTETLGYWVGPIYGHTNSVVNNEMSNAWFGQLRAGVKPTPQWDIMLAASYATADKKPVNPTDPGTRTYANGTYGTEIDMTGTYKITNNLSYMLGVGYLFTGDYFKGFDRAGQGYQIVDDYMLINKLTLSF